MNILFVDQSDIDRISIVAAKQLDMVTLNFAGFFDDTFTLVGDLFTVKALPFIVAEADVIKRLELQA